MTTQARNSRVLDPQQSQLEEGTHVMKQPSALQKALLTLRSVSRILALSAAVLSGLGILALTILTLANLWIRNAGGGGVPDAVGWGEVGVAAIAYLGLAYTQNLKAHVSTTVVVRLLSPRVRYVIMAIWMLVVCALIAWVGWETTQAAMESFGRMEARFGSVPVWPAKIAIALGMWLLLLELITQLLNHLFVEPESSVEEPLEEAQELAARSAA
jgi:TRAP-type mannitol/chloroaromatic compound transport system permease small subunit